MDLARFRIDKSWLPDLSRYRIENWPLPDLVAFNRRVHERVDPWWEKRNVRRATWTMRRPSLTLWLTGFST